ncbi:MAG: flagellar hook-length control protein FliK [Kordiimonadaceae bacterium]|nr:flagellar hook-length control protein FliK [Kordiimonadaceae bacterium]
MNAIEQMMQAFGASSAQSMAAFFGTAAASEQNAAGFAEQFTAAVRGAGQASPLSKTLNSDKTGAVELYALTGAEGASVSPELISQLQAVQAIEGVKLSDAPQTEAPIPDGLELVKVTPQDFAALFGDITGAAEKTSTAPTPATNALSDAQFLIIQAPGAAPSAIADTIHILPMAELEALITQVAPFSGNAVATSNVPSATNAATVASVATTDIAASAVIPSPASAPATAAFGATSDFGATAVFSTAPDEALANTALPAALKLATEPLTQAEQQQALKELAEKAPEAATLKAAKDQAVPAEAKMQKPAEADIYGVQAQQAATTAKKAQVANQLTGQVNTVANNQAATSAAAQAAPSNQPGDQKQGKSGGDNNSAARTNSQKLSAANTPSPTSQAVTAAPALTPERIAGIGEGAAMDTFASGLSGLRGEGSFMSTLSMVGGKAPSFLGGQIAKQLNMQVTRAVSNGTNEFTMKLNPTELGRVQVKMAFSSNGTVSAQVMVERPETLELLQREVRGLERAIEAGGHKADAGNISFSLDTGDGESAGKAMAEALQQDRHNALLEENAANNSEGTEEDAGLNTDKTDLAMLEEILSHVTPETGLDVRV